jgi:allophanate hydrolase
VLHAVPGPQDRFFDPPVLDRLFQRTFHLSAAFDRMGIRLDGPALPPREALSIPSEPIVRGSVQVSGDGVATILMADHQTTGGYPKIATVLDDDLDAFAQCRPGQPIAFRPVTAAEAVELARFRTRRHGWAMG